MWLFKKTSTLIIQIILCRSNLVWKELGGQEFTDNFDQIMKAKKCLIKFGFIKTHVAFDSKTLGTLLTTSVEIRNRLISTLVLLIMPQA